MQKFFSRPLLRKKKMHNSAIRHGISVKNFANLQKRLTAQIILFCVGFCLTSKRRFFKAHTIFFGTKWRVL